MRLWALSTLWAPPLSRMGAVFQRCVFRWGRLSLRRLRLFRRRGDEGERLPYLRRADAALDMDGLLPGYRLDAQADGEGDVAKIIDEHAVRKTIGEGVPFFPRSGFAAARYAAPRWALTCAQSVCRACGAK